MARDVRLIRSPISVLGMVLTTISAVLFLIVFLADQLGLHTNPYIGIVFFLFLPAVFLAGLILIPAGVWVERRRRAAGRAPMEVRWPTLDFNDSAVRWRAVLIFALTMANIVIVSLAAYRGVTYMDSVPFCGQACHGPMHPEFIAYQDGPHAHVPCVECHIGGGAPSFVRAKLTGVRQLAHVLEGRYPRPIPEPVRSMRPARDTCEHCHWSEQFHGDRRRKVYEYADDEKNTESVTTLQVHVGGGSARLGIATGIHWHMNIANEIEYVATDDKRQVIPYVRLKMASGEIREFTVNGVTPEQLAKGERRRMDCMDCHNRPSHRIESTPERAVNELIARGDLPKTLPFIHRESVKALKAGYPSQDAAMVGISRSLGDFYRLSSSGPSDRRASQVEKAVRAVQGLYRRNVFPEMRVGFGTYVNNLGHIDFPGCFRCHDDDHKSKNGKKIGQDCDTCHDVQT
jgi:hypothetical protein